MRQFQRAIDISSMLVSSELAHAPGGRTRSGRRNRATVAADGRVQEAATRCATCSETKLRIAVIAGRNWFEFNPSASAVELNYRQPLCIDGRAIFKHCVFGECCRNKGHFVCEKYRIEFLSSSRIKEDAELAA